MKPLTLILPLLLALGAALPARAQEAGAETYTLNVGEFSRLKVTKGINVDYRCSADSAGTVVFAAPADIVSLVSFANDKEELRIDFTREAAGLTGLPTVTVYSSYLTAVENTADSTVRVLSVLPGPSFKATLVGNGRVVVRDIKATRVAAKLATGNGQIVISGKCQEAAINMTGTGTIQADALEAQEVRVRALGTGSVGCWATDQLTIHGMGSTRIYYRGSPSVRNKALGVKVEPLP